MPTRTNASADGGMRLASLALIAMAVVLSLSNVMIGHRDASAFASRQRMRRMGGGDGRPIDVSVRGGLDGRSDDGHRRRSSEDDADTEDDENDDEIVVWDGELVTRILLGEEPFPDDDGGRRRLKYVPGTLHLGHADALRRCYVNATHYAGHLSDRPQSLVSLSDVHKLIYRNNPKSSSSSARHAMVSVCSHPAYTRPHLHISCTLL